MERYTFAVHIVAVMFTGKEICNVAPTTKQLVYCQLHYACTSICIVTCKTKSRFRSKFGKLLWCLPFLGLAGIGTLVNTAISFDLSASPFLCILAWHSTPLMSKTFRKNICLPIIWLCRSRSSSPKNHSIEGPPVRRFIDLKDMSHSTCRHWHDKTKSFLFHSFESADKNLSLTSYITLMRQNIIDRIEFF